MGDLVTEPDQTGDPNLVSVVIPAYNAAKWIEETLASVAAQTYGRERIEVVVVDDGSSDNSADIAERFLSTAGFNRWAVIRQENRGPSAARNVGWRWARGEWIRFLDADDLIDPEITSIQMDVARAQPPDVAIVYSSWCRVRIHNDGRREQIGTVVFPTFSSDTIADILTPGNFIATGTYILRTRWNGETIQWNESYSQHEDHDLLFDIAFAGGRFVPSGDLRPMMYYRNGHGTSLSTNHKQVVLAGLRCAQRVEEWCRANDALTTTRLQRIADAYGIHIRQLAIFDWKASSIWMKRLVRINPEFTPSESGRFGLIARIIGYRTSVRMYVGWHRFTRQSKHP